MFVRASSRRNKHGSRVSYRQLAHNVWDPASKSSKMRVLYDFGRAEEVDRAAVERLVGSLTRLLGSPLLPGAEQPAAAPEMAPGGGLSFVESRPLGGAYVLDALWNRLGIARTMRTLLGKTRRDAVVARVLFALVANRALAPSSKPAAAGWVSRELQVPGLGEVSDDACYRAMDWLPQVQPPTGAVRQAGLRSHGRSKDHRDDLPQVVVGMAVTRTGIPVRVWCWPGKTSDSALVRQVKADMRDGFTSAENRRYLQRAGGGYILGEKLRSGSAAAAATLGRAGRYQDVAGNLWVKEVKISEHGRFVVCHNPETADHDAAVRARLVARLEETIKGSDKLPKTRRAELRGVVSTKPGLNRFLRVTGGGLPRVDAKAIAAARSWTAGTCCAATTPTCPPRTSPWATSSRWRSNAAGAT